MLIEKKYSPIFHRQRQNFLQCRVYVCLITRPGKLEVGKHCRGRAYMKSGVQGDGAGRDWEFLEGTEIGRKGMGPERA